MNKTLLKTTMIAAIATLGMNTSAWAHHPSEELNPNYDMVDEQVSDMHNEVVDALLENDGQMSSTTRGSSMATSPTVSRGAGANAARSAARSASRVSVSPGRGATSAARSGGGRR